MVNYLNSSTKYNGFLLVPYLTHLSLTFSNASHKMPLRQWRILEYFLAKYQTHSGAPEDISDVIRQPPLHHRQAHQGYTACPMSDRASVTDNPIQSISPISLMHSLQNIAFTFLLCILGPKANNLWHILSLDTLKNVDTSNRGWSVGEKLNLKPKLIEVSQNLTLLEETLL